MNLWIQFGQNLSFLLLSFSVEMETKEDEFECKFCHKKLQSKASLTSHIKSFHESNFDHRCNLCQKVFVGRKPLTNHVKTVHKDTKVKLEFNECNG